MCAGATMGYSLGTKIASFCQKLCDDDKICRCLHENGCFSFSFYPTISISLFPTPFFEQFLFIIYQCVECDLAFTYHWIRCKFLLSDVLLCRNQALLQILRMIFPFRSIESSTFEVEISMFCCFSFLNEMILTKTISTSNFFSFQCQLNKLSVSDTANGHD